MSDEKQVTLDEAIEAALANPTPEPDPSPIEAEAPEAEAQEPSDGRERDEKGRFKAKSEEIAEPVAAEAPAEPVESAEPTPNAEPEKPKPAYTEGHFRGWSPEQRAKFDTLPPEAQDVVLALKRDTDANYTRKLEEASHTRKQLEPVSTLLNETADIFAAQGMSPVQAIQGYANIERVLTYGRFDEKVDLIGQICRRYGIPFAPQQHLEQMDPTQVQQFAALHDRDAEKLQLRAELDRTKRNLESFQHQQLTQQVETFSRATNPDGTPKHPLFETVKGHMGALLASSKATTLDEAYALAVEPITKALEEREAKARADADRQRQEAVDRAKKASPVKASAASPSGRTTAPKGIDAILNSALDQMGL